MTTPFTVLILALFLATAALAADKPEGVIGDGKTDDTAAIQKALEATAKTGGNLLLPPGKYVIAGNLNIPTGVCLQGSWDMAHHGEWEHGSTLLITGGRGKEDGLASIELNQSSAVRGFTMVWPEQKWDAIVPYPWAIHGQGMHNTVENVTFVNAYQGIAIGNPNWSELHIIRNVFGCVLRRGVQIDGCSDIGRIENVHFNPHYWQRSGHPSIPQGGPDHTGDTAEYMKTNLEAFIFGNSDWEYVLNTFVYAAKYGYHFTQLKYGTFNGQLMGIGADCCQVCVQIDRIQEIGIQVTNGEFTSFAGGENTAIVTDPKAGGAAQFVNCNFWANPGHIAHIQGNTQVTFGDCHFLDTPSRDGAILAEKGRLIVRSCFFKKPGVAIGLKPGVSAAIIMGNLQPGGLQVRNEIGVKAQIGLNEAGLPQAADPLKHYRLSLGAGGDEKYLTGVWQGPEEGSDGPSPDCMSRWSSAKAGLALPVAPDTDYELAVWLNLHAELVDPANTIAIVDGPSQPLVFGLHEYKFQITKALTAGKPGIELNIATKTFNPHKLSPADNDDRDLGVRAYWAEMTASDAKDTGPASANGGFAK